MQCPCGGCTPRRGRRSHSITYSPKPLINMADEQNADIQALIDGLNEDLSYEYQAIITYNSYAAMVSGIHRPLLRDFFEGEIVEELQHAQLLANKITALGGTPVTEPAPLDLKKSSKEMLEQVRQAEAETIDRYVQRREQAEACGEFGLATDLDDLIRDETEHKEETAKLLRDIRV